MLVSALGSNLAVLQAQSAAPWPLKLRHAKACRCHRSPHFGNQDTQEILTYLGKYVRSM